MIYFVFGSNLKGRHGAGAAKYARENFGAIEGQARGIQGHSYAIPTKDRNMKPLDLEDIKRGVDQFIKYASSHREDLFFVTRIGCGLAGYTNTDIAPMFRYAPENCNLDPVWEVILDRTPK